MASETDEQENGHSTVVRAVVAAAAGGAAAYGIGRLRSAHENDDDDVDDEDEDSEGLSGKREELTHALSSKVADAKNAASKLRSGGRSHRSTLADGLLPAAREAAASLGARVANTAPEAIRDELMPGFIEGFQKAAK